MSKTLDTDLYCFGVEYGDGTDDNHFHVGFTLVNSLVIPLF